MARQRIVESRVYRNIRLPFLGHRKRLDNVDVYVELRINQPVVGFESSVSSGIFHVVRQRIRQHFHLFFVQIRIVRPLHLLVPHFGASSFVQINFVVNPGLSLKRRHGSENVALFVQNAHLTFPVNVLGRLLVKPDEVQTCALKFFSSLIRRLKPQPRKPSENVFHHDLVDNARFRAVLFPRLHNDFRNPVLRQIRQNFLLRHVPLHLVADRHRPARNVRLVFSVRMYSPQHPHRFHCSAFGFPASVSPENPPVAFLAFVKRHLFFVHFFARIICLKPFLAAAFSQFFFDFYKFQNPFFFRIVHNNPKNALFLPNFGI